MTNKENNQYRKGNTGQIIREKISTTTVLKSDKIAWKILKERNGDILYNRNNFNNWHFILTLTMLYIHIDQK